MADGARFGGLPVLVALDEVRAALDDPGAAVLVAPPGTGKTTGVPPELLDEPWAAGGRVLLTEPRRLAARAAARRLAAVRGEDVGATVGYAVRGERRAGPTTRLEVVTEGLALRRLQHDPSLAGVAAVVVDEVHERSLDVDLLLAFLVEVRSALRPDLRVLVMSATVDAAPVASLLGGGDGPVPVVAVDGSAHPVRTEHRPGSAHDPVEDRVAAVVAEALAADPGDVLAFLPGRAEIRRTARALGRRTLAGDPQVLELHGSVPAAEQDRVLAPDPDGRRRVVLSTSLAETSLTVPGVRIVVDSGRRRTVRVDPGTGLPALVTEPVARSGADQRRGRAGRTAPGVAYRLWAATDDRHRPTADPPAIAREDLSDLVLQAACWGTDAADLPWLDAPPPPALDAARSLLADLGALDAGGRATALGRRLAELGGHPRVGVAALVATDTGGPALGAAVAAVLESTGGGTDLVDDVAELSAGRGDDALRRERDRWQRTLRRAAATHPGAGARRPAGVGAGTAAAAPGSTAQAPGSTAQAPASTAQAPGSTAQAPGSTAQAPASTASVPATVAAAVLAGSPDRVARRRSGTRDDDRGRRWAVHQLRSGGEVAVPADGPLGRAEWLVAVDLDAGARVAGAAGRLHRGIAVDGRAVLAALGHTVTESHSVTWDRRRHRVVARRARHLGAITLDDAPWDDPPADAVARAVADGLSGSGVAALARSAEADELRARVACLRALEAAGPPLPAGPWPDWSDGALVAADGPLGAQLATVRSGEDLRRLDVRAALTATLGRDGLRALDRLAPTHWSLPRGRRVPLRYGAVDGRADSVRAAVRVQDVLGVDEHPTVASGRLGVTLELRSPADRPVQVTADLPGFWRGSYAAVRAELRGRYPRHEWPLDPFE